MAEDMVAILTGELASHGASGFRVVQGGKHKKLYWTFAGKEMWHLIAGSPSDTMYRTLALNDVRRAIGVNQGSGPGERRVRTVRKREVEIAPPPDVITMLPDPMTPLWAMKQEMERIVEQQIVEVSTVTKRGRPRRAKAPTLMPVPTARERDWLNEMLARGERERHTVSKRKVTPGLAAAMLELNLANRPVTERQIDLHIGRLRRGDFILTHQGIAFSNTRVLNDGQHRLIAIARSGVTGDLQVTFGAEREEHRAVDAGRTRGARDLVGIHVKDVPVLRAAMARIVLMAESKSGLLDPQLIAEKALAIQAEDATNIALALAHAMKKIAPPASVSAAYYWIATHSPAAVRVNEFFEGMVSGEGLTGVKLKLREWLRDNTIPRSKMTGGQAQWRSAGIILGWNAWIRGMTNARFAWTDRGAGLPQPK